MNTKRKYISPKIESYSIDQEICLVMASVPDDPPGFGAAEKSTPDYPSTMETESPFGGSTPDYDN